LQEISAEPKSIPNREGKRGAREKVYDFDANMAVLTQWFEVWLPEPTHCLAGIFRLTLQLLRSESALNSNATAMRSVLFREWEKNRDHSKAEPFRELMDAGLGDDDSWRDWREAIARDPSIDEPPNADLF